MRDIVGQILSNRYTVIEKIGAGGMADVYKAHCNVLNRYVAVKILKDELKNEEEFVKRFKTESRAVALLNHTNIVSVFDVGAFDGRPFIVMELIEGITLKEYMTQKGVLDYKEAMFFIIQVLRALEHAHNRKIIHRDIKPQNIMLLRDGTIKVADFGIARFTMSNTQTMTDSAIGTAHYLSPEQAKGSLTNEKSDIYSVGIMLYEMVTGIVPYDSDNPVSVAIMHLSAKARMPREINDKIPPGFEEIIMKSMSKEPINRYENVSELLEDIEKLRKNPNISFEYKYAINESNPTQHYQRLNIEPPIQQQENAKAKQNGANRETGRRHNDNRLQQQKNKKLTPMKKVIIGLASVVLLVVLLMTVIFPAIFGDSPRDTITIPNLVNLSIDEVFKDSKYKDFEITETQRINDSKIEEGRIISQDPSSGSTRKKGAKIGVVVSGGTKKVKLSDYINTEYRYAKVELENQDLKTKKVEQYHDTIPSGSVIKTDPGEGAEVAAGSEVTLYVSMGKEMKPVKVPSLIGLSQNDARNKLISANLTVGEVTQVASDKPRGEVVSQSVDEGDAVEEKTAISFEISLGMETTRQLEVNLPEEPKTFTLKILQNNVKIYDEEHKASDKKVTVPIRGTGTAMINVYINDVLYFEKVIKFDEPDTQASQTGQN